MVVVIHIRHQQQVNLLIIHITPPFNHKYITILQPLPEKPPLNIPLTPINLSHYHLVIIVQLQLITAHLHRIIKPRVNIFWKEQIETAHIVFCLASGDESDSEAYDQTSSAYAKRTDNHPNVSYGTVIGHDSLASIDPFEKKINQRDPYYRKRQEIHKYIKKKKLLSKQKKLPEFSLSYAEPILKVRRFPSNNTSDYAPIPVAHKQTNSQRDSYGYYH